MEHNIMLMLYFLIKIAYIFNIDLDTAWEDWKTKAYKKKYQTSSSYSSNVSC